MSEKSAVFTTTAESVVPRHIAGPGRERSSSRHCPQSGGRCGTSERQRLLQALPVLAGKRGPAARRGQELARRTLSDNGITPRTGPHGSIASWRPKAKRHVPGTPLQKLLFKSIDYKPPGNLGTCKSHLADKSCLDG